MTIDQKALEAARNAIAPVANMLDPLTLAKRVVNAYLAALPASDHAGLVERLEREARAFDTDNGSDPEADAGTAKILREAATALSALPSPAPLEGVTEEQVERAFKDGLAYGSNVEGADPETAWMQSRVRASLGRRALKNQESDRG